MVELPGFGVKVVEHYGSRLTVCAPVVFTTHLNVFFPVGITLKNAVHSSSATVFNPGSGCHGLLVVRVFYGDKLETIVNAQEVLQLLVGKR